MLPDSRAGAQRNGHRDLHADRADAGPGQTANDADGDNAESLTLDGSNSYDPDGTITSYEWKKGATVLGIDEIITYDFTVGTHTVTLTVTDNGGATDTDECIITVVANQPPIADAGPDQSGYVDDTFTFDGSGCSDPDGSIVSYYWDFDDGSDAYGEIVTHTYTTAGTYIVTLTVTDNGGLTDSDQATVTAEETQSETEEFFDSFEVSEWNGLWVEDSQNDWFRSKHRSIASLVNCSSVPLSSMNFTLSSRTSRIFGKPSPDKDENSTIGESL